MSILPLNSRDAYLATMVTGLAATMLSFTSGVAGADNSVIPTPDPGAFTSQSTADSALTTPSETLPAMADSTLATPSLVTPSPLTPTTAMPGSTAAPTNGALLPTLLVETGNFLGQLGNALAAGTPATVPAS